MIKIDATAYYKTKDLLEVASLNTLRGWIKTKKLKARKVGRDYVIKGHDLIELLESPENVVASKTAKKKPKKS